MAEGSFFSWLNEETFKRPTVSRFCSLLDNYNPHEGYKEEVTSQEKQEQAAFIEEISRTKPIRYLHKYLSAKDVAPENYQDFKKILTSLWFDLYGRGGTSGSSSAFEHVVGEIKQRGEQDVSGFHNWIQFMRRTVSVDSLLYDPEIEKTAKALRKARREELKLMAENREEEEKPVPIRDHFKPVINTHYSGIARGTIHANTFELKPALINMVQQNQFGGSAVEDPNLHLRTFLEIADTVKMNGVTEDTIRLRLFPFSLRDGARSWLQSLPLGSITTWVDMATKFLTKYFPPAKAAQLRIEITTFRQYDAEQLHEAWERYKEMLRKCPNHNFEDWVQIELFYNGLNASTRMSVDAAAGGTIFAKPPSEAYDMLEQMTFNSYQWPSERSMPRKTAGIYEVDSTTALSSQLAALSSQLATLSKGGHATGLPPTDFGVMHEQANYINNRGYGNYRGKL